MDIFPAFLATTSHGPILQNKDNRNGPDFATPNIQCRYLIHVVHVVITFTWYRLSSRIC